MEFITEVIGFAGELIALLIALSFLKKSIISQGHVIPSVV